jgi:hypothetical protein
MLTCAISVGALLSGLHARNVWPHFIIGYGTWYVYALSQRGRVRRNEARRRRAFLHEQCMRVYLRNNGFRY